MASHGRRVLARIPNRTTGLQSRRQSSKQDLPGFWAAIVLVAAFALPTLLSAQTIDWRMPASWKQDAELTDLFFIDRDQGWIVGDRGLVMRTADGGKTWQNVTLYADRSDPQAPPITCRLESVFFASPTHGYIAGGYSNPGATTSIGVVFATVDGGTSWKRLQGIALPKINQVMFTTPLEGIAIGDGNALKPSGVFHTRDGGRSWSSNSRGAIQSWQTASHANGVTVLASAEGRLARYVNNELADSLVNNSTQTQQRLYRIRQTKMLDERFGFAVGDFGRFLHTRNGGYSWDPVTSFDADFRTLAVQGNRIWVAGNPGTRIWTRSTDQAEWQSFATPIRTPIAKIRFVDEAYGWAIGLCGDILHTQDSGQSWTIQRRGTDGVALLQVASQTSDFVPELFSKYCADENYIGASMFLNLNVTGFMLQETLGAVSGPVDTPTLDQLRKAMSRVGAAFVDDRAIEINISSSLINSSHPMFVLAKQIRSLRPRVIAIPSGRVKELHNLRGSVLRAVELAADPEFTSRHGTSDGLEPWQVGKVVVVDRGDVANLKISPGHYMMDVGALLTDHSAVSRLLLDQPFAQSSSISLTTIFTSPYAAGTNNRLFGGIENTDAEVPVRKGQKRTAGNMAQMRLLAGKRKTLNRLLDGSPNLAVWNGNLSELAMQLDDAAAGVWLFELASLCDAKGLTELAVQTHLYLTSQYRQHPLATSSFRWLFNHYSSAEQAHIAIRQAQLREAAQIEVEIPQGGVQSRPVQHNFNGVNVVSWEVDDPRNQNNAVQSANWTDADRNNIFRRRFQQARSIGQSFALVDPTALDAGRYELLRIGLNRRLDPLISVDEPLKRLASSDNLSVAEAAMLELGILNRRDETERVKDEVTCAKADKRPWLDGDLNDEIWQSAMQQQSFIPLSDVGNSGGRDRVVITTDDEFLYIAVRCLQQIDQTYSLDDGPRVRDSNLEIADRVEIAIDIDRDYETFYLFAVDSSGQVAESFGNNLAWNPSWYVASKLEDPYWIAEIAIPLEEISNHGDFWSIAASRHIRNQLVSSGWRPSENNTAVAPEHQASLHRAAHKQQTAMHAIPMPAFRLVRMPWANDDKRTTRALPQGK